MMNWKKILSLLLTGSLLCGIALPCVQAEDSLFTEEMVQRSLLNIGNTSRLHAAIEKAKSGKDVTLVYLGGSITEGSAAKPQQTHCYAALSAKMFAEKFAAAPEKVHYVNAGISGTPSRLGITRLEQDVLSKSPDVVFIEFAVNDSNDKQSQMVYESLVRRLLQSETSPAVILIFTLLNSGYSCQPHMSQIGGYYDLGMISVKNALQPEFTSGRMTFQDYSADYAHPTTEGHAFIADMVGYYFDQAAATPPEGYTMPENPVIGNFCEKLENIRPGSPLIVAEGSFPQAVTSCYSYIKGWKHTMFTKTDPMVLEVQGGPLFIVFKQENNEKCGKMEVWVDGALKTTLNGHSTSAWGNPVTEIIGLGNVKETHTVELRMAEGDHMKDFSILDIAYVPAT
ncbi:MAG: SGNH/GDSL hydrolase family protein [Clostridia bacterium]|nr:SGNH/GDSL hydrolase family protein [Clostridia bacterium]